MAIRKAYIYTLTMSALATIFISCGKNSAGSSESSKASFDYFHYEGNDDFYKANPLPTAESLYNPLLPGWYSDPTLCTNGEGDYFLATSTFAYFPGVPLFHSRDMVNWRQVGNILSRESQLINMASQSVSEGIFAPALAYNKQNKTYYMITTNVGVGNFFVKTQNPFGEWSDPIALPEVGGIDPSFFFDDNGKAYIVNNDEAPDKKPEYDGHRTIMIQEFDVENDKTIGERKIIVNKGVHPEDKPIWIEGPHLYKINGKYMLMAAEGGTSEGHSEVLFTASEPMGPYTPVAVNPILTQRHLNPDRPNPVTCSGHADLIQTNEGDWWAVFLACRPIDLGYENLGRETFMMPVRWTAEKTPYITKDEEVVPMIIERQGVRPDSCAQRGNFSVDVDFEADKLPLDWMSLRTSAEQHYSLAQKGCLQLTCSPTKLSDKGSPAYICRRIQHHKFTCETRMHFKPEGTEQAGLAIFKDEQHYYYFTLRQADSSNKLCVCKVEKGTTTELASACVDNSVSAVDLRIVSEGTSFGFLYNTGNEWIKLADNINAAFLSTAYAGGFTGTTIGFYAEK